MPKDEELELLAKCETARYNLMKFYEKRVREDIKEELINKFEKHKIYGSLEIYKIIDEILSKEGKSNG